MASLQILRDSIKMFIRNFFRRRGAIQALALLSATTLLGVVYVVRYSSRAMSKERYLIDVACHALSSNVPPAPSLRPSVYEAPLLTSQQTADSAARGPPKIPHIIHQTYKSRSIPQPFAEFVASWPERHPSWKYVFWTDADIADFVRDYYPAYEHLFDRLPASLAASRFAPIYRSDLVRYLILDFFGGVYADLDTQSLRPLDPLTRAHHAVVSREPAAFALSSERFTLVQACNAFMMSAPGHPVWTTVLETVAEKVRRYPLDPVQVTGPVALDEALRRYRCRRPWSRDPSNTVLLAPSAVFYGNLPWMNSTARVNSISHHCWWLEFVGQHSPKVDKVCKAAGKGQVDFSFDPSVPPEHRFVLHHGSQIYADDRLQTSHGARLVRVDEIVPHIANYRDLLPRNGKPHGETYRTVNYQ